MSTPERLVQILTNKGSLPPGSPWADAVARVRRELFLPDTFEANDRVFDRSRDPKRWAWAVYADRPLVTQINGGQDLGEDAYQLPTSSSSMPTVMLQMLDLLHVRDGDTVFEAGAGTGYNAAWLCHRLGPGRVTTMDIDPEVAKQAEANLSRAGFAPRVLSGNAEEGLPDGGPYDRVVATFTVPEIPYPWVEQTAEGGRIVAPWGGGIHHYGFAVLDVRDGRAAGRFAGYPAFMRTRTQPAQGGRLRDFYHHEDEAAPSRTHVSPLDISGDSDALFWIDTVVREAWHRVGEADDGSEEATLWLLSADRASWATAEYVPGQTEYAVEQYGPRRLWDEVEAAYRKWVDHGRPERDRAGLTVTREGQHVWLDDEDNVIATVPAAVRVQY
ncbi:methyltransferase domain-containing protein [Streptomyces sp. UNOB3_S3]|uniref:methyltransferase domain-containing protein n=1 Tax=Streptomyces sp. UNOB3_S3 TaxID=2871682 RepID=UPI001E578B8C|nr:methyltransferase domain-containing protein [Streptomyces sp. UNOB3_S3]MCC3776658.1 methyltransferase domain-containing protein [Streptomyces sp. UNOB3_S3]